MFFICSEKQIAISYIIYILICLLSSISISVQTHNCIAEAYFYNLHTCLPILCCVSCTLLPGKEFISELQRVLYSDASSIPTQRIRPFADRFQWVLISFFIHILIKILKWRTYKNYSRTTIKGKITMFLRPLNVISLRL